MRHNKDFPASISGTSVNSLGLSVRNLYLLKKKGVFSVGQLLTMPYGELLGLGKEDCAQVQAAIEQCLNAAKGNGSVAIEPINSHFQESEKPELPAWMLQWPIEGVELTTGTCFALRRDGIHTVGNLVRLTDPEMMQLRWLRKGKITDIQRAIKLLAALLALPSMPELLIQSDQSPGHPIRILSSRCGIGVAPSTLPSELQSDARLTVSGWLVPASFERHVDTLVGSLGLSRRSTNILEKCGIRSLNELLLYPRMAFCRTKNLGQKSMAELELKVFEYLSGRECADFALNKRIGNRADSASPGTKELVNHMLGCLGDRQRRIVARRYGLWDGVVHPLQDIGHSFKLTRERIRQIEMKSLEQIRRQFTQYDATKHLCTKVRKGLSDGVGRSGDLLSRPELIAMIADDCNCLEASLAVTFLRDIWATQGDIFAPFLIMVEEGVYCTGFSTADQYLTILELVKSVLDERKKPLFESELCVEIKFRSVEALGSDQETLARQIIARSPSLARLANGTILLARWVAFNTRIK